jgi:hypothetical protein
VFQERDCFESDDAFLAYYAMPSRADDPGLSGLASLLEIKQHINARTKWLKIRLGGSAQVLPGGCMVQYTDQTEPIAAWQVYDRAVSGADGGEASEHLLVTLRARLKDTNKRKKQVTTSRTFA